MPFIKIDRRHWGPPVKGPNNFSLIYCTTALKAVIVDCYLHYSLWAL